MSGYLQRIGWMLFAFGLQALYFPINRLDRPALALKTPLDELIPLWPAWVLPYTLTWVMWLACAAWVAWKMDAKLYKAAIAALVVSACIGVTCFLALPTCVERPVVPGNDWTARLLRAVHQADTAANAFPSAHIYITTLIALFADRWYPRQRLGWIVILAMVSLSTLFTHQHYLADVIGGLALAWVGFRLGLAFAFKPGGLPCRNAWSSQGRTDTSATRLSAR
jgi:membrane-associated phospholipid phosphatase